MATKRNYPLFVIDASRSHGRGCETDYISCTSNECPFIAQVTLHHENEYKELYHPEDFRSLWADPRNGVFMRLHIVSDLPKNTNPSQVRTTQKSLEGNAHAKREPANKYQ